MRILQLCKKFPFPLKDGEAVAVTNMSRSLRDAGARVTLLAMNTSKHPTDLTQLPADFEAIFEEIHAVFVNNFITVGGALRNLLFDDLAYHVSRFVNADFEDKLREILVEIGQCPISTGGGHFDVVLVETVFLAPYIPTIRRLAPDAKIVLRAHNVEHEVWERFAKTIHNPLKIMYLHIMNRRLKRFEIGVLNDFDFVVAITKRDAALFEKLGFRGKVVAAPVGLAASEYVFSETEFEKSANLMSISFIGSLDWMPNQEGVRWFLEEVWKPYFSIQTDLKFFIAGINPPNWLRDWSMPNVVVLGEIADAKLFLKAHSVMVAPLFSGSGIRVKILEAMMLGRVVITSSTGLEGIDATDGIAVLIANTAAEFREKIEFCQKNPSKMIEISKNAREWVVANFDRTLIGQNLVKDFKI